MTSPNILAGYIEKSVETAVNDCQGARHERRSVADEVVDRTQQFLGFGETARRGVGDDRPRTVGVRTVGIGEQRAVLVRQQEARTMALTRISGLNFMASSAAMYFV